MIGLKLIFVQVLLFRTTATSAGSFKDDLGKEFTFNGKPKIVCPADIALTLRDFGMTEEQIVGTYGSWVTTGSDLDFDKLSEGSTLPADPSPDELKWLDTKVVNLSPDCKNNVRCKTFKLDTLKTVDPEYVILWGYTQSPFAIDADLIANMTEMGYETVYIEISQNAGHGNGTVCKGDLVNGCFGKSMVEVAERWEKLTVALGTTLPESVQVDKKLMCEAAAKFTEASKEAHERGVRVMAQYPTETSISIANPVADVVLRMFEELGMPIMHPGGLCKDEDGEPCYHSYFWESVPRDSYFSDCDPSSGDCVDKMLYNVDMVLYDHRLTVKLQNATNIDRLGDPALKQGQMAYWPIGGRPHTYRHATEILNLVTPELKKAKRIHSRSDCTKNIDVSSTEHRETSLMKGQYACFNPEFHNEDYTCPSSDGSLTNMKAFVFWCSILFSTSILLW